MEGAVSDAGNTFSVRSPERHPLACTGCRATGKAKLYIQPPRPFCFQILLRFEEPALTSRTGILDFLRLNQCVDSKCQASRQFLDLCLCRRESETAN